MGTKRARTRANIWSPDGVDPVAGTPLFQHLLSVLPSDGRGPLPNGGAPYPDDPPPDPTTLSMGTALDGIMAVRGGHSTGDSPLLAAAAIREACRQPLSTETVHTVAERLRQLEAPNDFDRLLEAIRIAQPAARVRLAELARWLCRFGVERRQVQAGLVMLGVYGQLGDRVLISQLGLLDALTLYSSVALINLLDEPEPAIFELAKQVDGWGRIHTVYRLRRTSNPVVRDWLLRGGYDSGVMVEELAFIAACAGELAEALQGDMDEDLLDHAGVLLAALATGGPAEDMSDYPPGEVAMGLYLEHMKQATATLPRLHSLDTLSAYLDDWARENPHLPQEARERLAQQAHTVLDRPEWAEAARRGVDSEDLHEFRNAIAVSRRLGIDPLPRVREWLEREPHDGLLWYVLMGSASRDEMAELLQLAERLLPFEDLPIGPTLELGFGPQYEANNCFDLIVQELQRYPGLGWDVMKLALLNRATRPRFMAVRALAEWDRDMWPEDGMSFLASIVAGEPDDELRTKLQALLQNAPSAPE